MLRLTDDYTSYCLDAAVAYLGRTIEAELDGVEGKNAADSQQKRARVLSRFLDDEAKPPSGLYADPMASR